MHEAPKKSMKKLINFQHQNLFTALQISQKKYFIKKSLIKFKSIHQIIIISYSKLAFLLKNIH